MKILGVDPSKSCTGIAKLTIGAAAKFYQTWPLKNVHPGDFYKFMQSCAAQDIDVAFIESHPGGGWGYKTVAIMSEIRGMIMEVCAVYNIHTIDLPTNHWRDLVLGEKPHYITEKGKSRTGWTKKKGIDNLTPVVDAYLIAAGIDIEGKTMDEKEALCIAMAGYELIKSGDITLPKKKESKRGWEL